MVRPVPQSIVAALLAVATAAVRAQEWQRFVNDLGVPERTEAAERALLALGPNGLDALAQALTEPVTNAADCDRVRAVARVVDLVGEAGADLIPALDEALDRAQHAATAQLLDALASLAPYGSRRKWHRHFVKCRLEAVDRETAYVAYCRLAERSNRHPPGDFTAAQAILAADNLFERELAAEAFLRLRDPACLEPLRDRLLARDRLPAGHDGLRHNGFVVPMRDRFALRAAQAMVAIAPTDPKCVIAWAVLAVEHPHPTFRLQALRTLAGFGPDAGCAATELVALASGNDAVVAAEALKVLGMTGDAARPHAASLMHLADHVGMVGKLAKALLDRLRASGAIDTHVVAFDPRAAASARAAMLAAAVALDKAAAAGAAERTLRTDPAGAFAVLSERFQRDRTKVSDRAVRLLSELATSRSAAERQTLRFGLASLGHEHWFGPTMSSSSGRDEAAFRPAHAEAHGRLELDGDAVDDLVVATTAFQPTRRIAALRQLAVHADWIAAATEEGARVRETLLGALTNPVDSTLTLPVGHNSECRQVCDLRPAIRAATAIALRACDLRPRDAMAMFAAALTSDDDPERIAAAVRRFGPEADSVTLERAVADPRSAVADAARAVQATRSPGK